VQEHLMNIPLGGSNCTSQDRSHRLYGKQTLTNTPAISLVVYSLC